MSERIFPTDRHGNPLGPAVEEVVRCRDCKAMRIKYGNVGIECWMNGEPFTVEPDGYCAWGARADE